MAEHTDYNAAVKILQGGNVLEVGAGGSINFEGGGGMVSGTAASPNTSSTSAKKFWSIYNKATGAGDVRGIYNRLYIEATGGSGESLRSFTTVDDLAASTAHGAHISLNFADGDGDLTFGKVTGLGVGVRATLHLPDAAAAIAGTMAAIQAEIWSDGAASDPAGATVSAIRVVNDGHANGIADADDDVYLLHFAGWSAGSGHMIGALGNEPSWANKTRLIKCKLDGVGDTYLVAIDL